ncbi:MAG: S4 domain-containing protein [Pseudomonadota bacterium]
MTADNESKETMRLDQLLVFLRFAKTRSVARAMIESGRMRLNSSRITKISHDVAVGDVLTFALRGEVCVALIEQLPQRRLSAKDASKAWTQLGSRI